MTGLNLQDSKQEYLDEMQDRYAQVCMICTLLRIYFNQTKLAAMKRSGAQLGQQHVVLKYHVCKVC